MKRLIALASAFTLVASVAGAHVTVAPMRSDPGAVQEYELRCHNEGELATTALELEIPDGVTVLEVAAVEGGTFELVRTADRVTSVKWNVTVPANKYVELKFSAKNPAAEQEVQWNIRQVLENGTSVDWSFKPGAAKKGSITKIGPAE